MDFSAFYTDTITFTNYGLEHFFSVLLVATFGLWFLRKGKYSWDENQKWRYAIIFAFSLYGIQLFKTFFRMYLGNFDISQDLPLQLCNILPLIIGLGLYFRSRLILSVVFFWILAGDSTSQHYANPKKYFSALRVYSILDNPRRFTDPRSLFILCAQL